MPAQDMILNTIMLFFKTPGEFMTYEIVKSVVNNSGGSQERTGGI